MGADGCGFFLFPKRKPASDQERKIVGVVVAEIMGGLREDLGGRRSADRGTRVAGRAKANAGHD